VISGLALRLLGFASIIFPATSMAETLDLKCTGVYQGKPARSYENTFHLDRTRMGYCGGKCAVVYPIIRWDTRAISGSHPVLHGDVVLSEGFTYHPATRRFAASEPRKSGRVFLQGTVQVSGKCRTLLIFAIEKKKLDNAQD
jgi:hypothetical protein